MNVSDELILRLRAADDLGATWEIRSRSHPGVYVVVFIPKAARREEVAQRFAFGISDAMAQCAGNV